MAVALLSLYIYSAKWVLNFPFFVYFKLNIKFLKMLKAFKFPLSHTCYNNVGTLFENIILTSTYQKNKSIILTSCLLEMSILGLINQLWAIVLFLEMLMLRFL